MTFRSPRQPQPIVVPTGTITAITASPRAPGRFDLLIDGNAVARLSIEGVERLRLQVGRGLGESEAMIVGAEAEVTRSYDRAMAMLAARGRASGELKRLLVQKGEPPLAVNQAIDRLQAAGFLDDRAFARQFTRHLAVNGGMSRRRIERELTRRGVERGTAAEVIAATFAEEGVDESAAIEAAAEKKLRTLSRVDPPTRRRRLYGFLARRGYDADAINRVVHRLTKASVRSD